ncbi:MAG: SRPBCC family protein [Bacteroidales bacterium]|nr:SRPBCC family protein [Bacteroidales bacterium]
MTKVVSKIKAIRQDEDKIYAFVSDFNNLDELVPPDKIQNWKSSADSCHFDVTGIGSLGMQITEKEPYKLVKVQTYQSSPMGVTLWIQIKQVNPGDSRIRLTAQANMNPLMKGLVSKHLQQGIDAMVDKLAEYLNHRSDL